MVDFTLKGKRVFSSVRANGSILLSRCKGPRWTGGDARRSTLLQPIHHVEVGEDPEVVIHVALAVCAETYSAEGCNAACVRWGEAANIFSASGIQEDTRDLERKSALADEKALAVALPLDRGFAIFEGRGERLRIAAL